MSDRSCPKTRRKSIKVLLRSLLHIVYPPLCAYCRELQPSHRQLLCNPCLELLHLIEPGERCPVCFMLRDKAWEHRCAHTTFRHAAAFEYAGPAASLTRQLKYSGRLHLATSMAGYMGIQFLRLNWPPPDIIIPVPISFSHFIMRGYNQSKLLAEQLAKILDRPVVDTLKRKSGDFSQSALDKRMREQLSSHSFSWKKRIDIADKVVLLVDDVATTKTTLSHCAALLQEGFPKRVYALTLCMV